MADVDATLAEWSSTDASNKPSGATTIGTNLDDNLRTIQGVIVRGLSHKGSDIASVAGTTDIGAVEGLMHDITGTETITGFGTVRAGIWKVLKYEGAATITHNATSLILLGGANRVTANGDTQILISEGSGNWRELAYFVAGNGVSKVLTAEQASTSGTSIDFTGIPSWAKQVVVMFDGVSTSGTDDILIQLGDAGGAEDSGYASVGGSFTSAAQSTVASTAGFIMNTNDASDVFYGSVTITLEDAANFTWVAQGVLSETATTAVKLISGRKATSAAMSLVRITTVGGTDTFDAGAISVLYE